MTRSSMENIIGMLIRHGRTVYDAGKDVLFTNWTCSGFSIGVDGTELRARVISLPGRITPRDPEASLPLYLPCIGTVEDGELILRQECTEGEQWITLWESTPRKRTAVQIVKLSENSMGKIGFLELETDGFFFRPEEENRPVMEVIGDSITCGFGNETKSRYDAFRTADENGWITYGMLAARHFALEPSLVSVSGICAVRHGTYSREPVSMEEMYPYTDHLYTAMSGTEDERWKRPADVVVINLGTNDAAVIRMLGEERRQKEIALFGVGYRRFLRMVREMNGSDAWILCTLGPMDHLLNGEIRSAAEQVSREDGDRRIRSFFFSAMDPETEGLGCEDHPTAATHVRMAEELIAFMDMIDGLPVTEN